MSSETNRDASTMILDILLEFGSLSNYKHGLLQRWMYKILKTDPAEFLKKLDKEKAKKESDFIFIAERMTGKKGYTNEEIDIALKKLVKDDKNWDAEYNNRGRPKNELVPVLKIGNEEESDIYMVKIPFGLPFGSRYWFVGMKKRN